MKKIILILAVILSFIILLTFKNKPTPLPQLAATAPTAQKSTQVKYPQDYTLVLVGDSMTQILGNCDELKEDLKKYYPKKSFECLNYGFGSTNILSLQERLEKETFFGRNFRPITEIDFDAILIESFGHNPLSQYPLEEGLKKQTEVLQKAFTTLKKTNPRAKIVFVATIAPSVKKYGFGQVELSTEERGKWAGEREAYIKNHINFAQANNIPLINIYEKSLKEGDLNLDLVSSNDFIHPSPTGVRFISREIADFLYNQIFR